MTVDIAAIRARADRYEGAVPVMRADVLALCDLAERTQEREGITSTHWEDCWKAHDRCAAALYRKEREA